MPPKFPTATGARRGRPPGKPSGAAPRSTSTPAGIKRKRPASTVAQGTGDDDADEHVATNDELLATLEAFEEKTRVAIPSELLRRILHQAFKDKGVRMTQEASAGFAKYLDLFLREAIRRTSDEKKGTFLEVSASAVLFELRAGRIMPRAPTAAACLAETYGSRPLQRDHGIA